MLLTAIVSMLGRPARRETASPADIVKKLFASKAEPKRTASDLKMRSCNVVPQPCLKTCLKTSSLQKMHRCGAIFWAPCGQPSSRRKRPCNSNLVDRDHVEVDQTEPTVLHINLEVLIPPRAAARRLRDVDKVLSAPSRPGGPVKIWNDDVVGTIYFSYPDRDLGTRGGLRPIREVAEARPPGAAPL